MKREDILEELFSEAEGEYARFSLSLLPGQDKEKLIGVRLPNLRKIAKRLAKEKSEEYFALPVGDYFEERMLRGMTIGYQKTSFEQKIKEIDEFLPLINNWSLCDSFVGGLKITNTHKKEMLSFLKEKITSNEEYTLRFCVVMLLCYYIDDEYLEQVFVLLAGINHESYYVKMAIAWAISICYLYHPVETEKYLREQVLDAFVFDKSLQKIIESRRIDEETRQEIKRWRKVRKERTC